VSRHRVRSSTWPYAAAAIVFGALSAWLLFGRTDDVTQVRLPESTTIVVTKTTTATPKVLLPETTGAPTTTRPTGTASTTTARPASTAVTTTTGATTTTATAITNAASQAPVPGERVATVIVVDASGHRPLAARAAIRLILAGWSHVATDGADQPAALTRVLTLPGFENAGSTAIADLGLAVAVESLADPAAFGDGTADIVVLLGQDAAAP
jgi:hypothetical protein